MAVVVVENLFYWDLSRMKQSGSEPAVACQLTQGAVSMKALFVGVVCNVLDVAVKVSAGRRGQEE